MHSQAPSIISVQVQVVAAEEIATGRTVALKVIFLDNPRLEPDHVSILRQEFSLMSRLSHPNVASIECVMEDPVRKQMAIAEEICLGGSLVEELQGADSNDDRMLRIIFKQLFEQRRKELCGSGLTLLGLIHMGVHKCGFLR